MFTSRRKIMTAFLVVPGILVFSDFANEAHADAATGFWSVSFFYIPFNNDDSVTGNAEARGSTEKDASSSVKGDAYALVSQTGQNPVYSVAHSSHSASCKIQFDWIYGAVNPDPPSSSIDGTYTLTASATHLSYGSANAQVTDEINLSSGLGTQNPSVSMSGSFHRTANPGLDKFYEDFAFSFSASAQNGWLNSGKGTGSYKVIL